MNKPFNNLAFSIIERAVNDYKLLKKLGVSKIVFDSGETISIRETEKFFRSTWCDYLLQNMNITGEDILRYLNRA